MTLSQEILVLDFGDEKQSDFLKSDASIDFSGAGKTRKRRTHLSDGRSLYANCMWNIYFQTKQ